MTKIPVKFSWLVLLWSFLFCCTAFADVPMSTGETFSCAETTVITPTCRAVISGFKFDSATLKARLARLPEDRCHFSETDIASIAVLLNDVPICRRDGPNFIVPYTDDEFSRLSMQDNVKVTRAGQWIGYRTREPWWRSQDWTRILLGFITLGSALFLLVIIITQSKLNLRLIALLPVVVGLVWHFFSPTIGAHSVIISLALSPLCAAVVSWLNRWRAAVIVFTLIWLPIAFIFLRAIFHWPHRSLAKD